MTLARFFAGAPQGGPLVNQGVVTDDRRFANHHPHAVINKDPSTQLSAGVNFDAGQAPSHGSNQTGKEGDMAGM
jgi:hypothetical protein